MNVNVETEPRIVIRLARRIHIVALSEKTEYGREIGGQSIMPISFFKTDKGEFYATIDPNYLNQETFEWLGRKRIDAGRKTAFTVAEESPVFNNVSDAEEWLKKNWFADRPDRFAEKRVEQRLGGSVIHFHGLERINLSDLIYLGERWQRFPSKDPDSGPCQDDYEGCARDATDYNELAGMACLDQVLPHERNHSYLCSIGIWYWQLGFMNMAVLAYERSIEIKVETPTLFNLAICLDDLGLQEKATQTIAEFYRIIDSEEEREQAESMLCDNDKNHLLRDSLGT